ncbi:MAG: PucR family transcriptional regulator [Pelosinus sp.]|nr:PucR family transcriptional regulator [Pelosinus sp.]
MNLKDLFEQSKKKYRLQLIAGEKGSCAQIKWIYLLEDLNNISFIRGGELIITTGLASNYDGWLEDLFHAMEGKNISGIILNVGRYINKIPASLLDYCNRMELPLLTMPWEIHIADIMQDCCNSLLKEKQQEDYLSKTFVNAMFNNIVDHTFIAEYEAKQINFIYGLIAFKNTLNDTVMAVLNQTEQKYVLINRQNILYAVLYHTTEKKLSIVLNILHKSLSGDIYYGIATISHSIADLSARRLEADKALTVAIATKKTYCRYDKLGLYQIILGIAEQAILDNLYTQCLQAIIEYDQKHQANYLEILRYYIEFNSSVQMVAEHTFTHRNTINYRITKIKELLHSDLTSPAERCRLQLAFCYYDLKAHL